MTLHYGSSSNDYISVLIHAMIIIFTVICGVPAKFIGHLLVILSLFSFLTMAGADPDFNKGVLE